MIGFESNTVQVHIAAYDNKTALYKYLIIQRADTKQPYPGVWQVITGTMESNETAVKTAIREIYEEIGIKIQANDLWTIPFVASFFNPYADKVLFSPVFGIVIDLNSPINLSDEHQAFQWVNIEQLKEKLIIPSHVLGTEIFEKYILNNPQNHFYKLKSSIK